MKAKFSTAVAGVAIGLIMGAVPLLAVGSAAATTSAAAAKVPFHDADAKGTLTFCNRAGQPITSGSIYSAPFAWKTVSSVPAPRGYRSSAARATLYVYQPIKYVDPGDWTGAQLTGSSSFTNSSHPVDQATNRDLSLTGFVHSYPSHWGGVIQVRMFFSAINTGAFTTTYPAAVLKISGNTWTLVSGGGTSCQAGRGLSDETRVLPKRVLKHPHDDVPVGQQTPPPTLGVADSSPPASSTGATTAPIPGSSTGGAAGLTKAADTSPVAESSGGLSSGAKAGIVVAILAVVGLLGGGLAWWRRTAGDRS